MAIAKRTHRYTVTLACVIALGSAVPLLASDAVPQKGDVSAIIGQSHFSPYAGRNFPTNVYFGDTHLHTAVSTNAHAARG